MSSNSKTVIPKPAQLIIGQYITKFNAIDRQVSEVEVHKAFLISDLAERLMANGYATKEIIYDFLCDALVEVVDEETIIRSLPKVWVPDSVIDNNNSNSCTKRTPTELSDQDLDVIKQLTVEFQKHIDRLQEENYLLRNRHKEDKIRIDEIAEIADRNDRELSKQDQRLNKISLENIALRKALKQKQIYIEASEMMGLYVMEAECIKKEKSEPRWNPSGDRNRKIIFDVNNKTGQVEGCHLEP